MKKMLMLLSFFALMTTVYGQNTQNGVRATVTVHPAELKFKAGRRTYYKIYSYGTAMFVTKEKKIFTEIADHLPVVAVEGREASIVGSAVKLASLMSLKQIRKIRRRTGIDFGNVTVYEITGYNIKYGSNESVPGSEKKAVPYNPPGN